MVSFFIYSCGWFITHDCSDIFSCTSKQLLSLESHIAILPVDIIRTSDMDGRMLSAYMDFSLYRVVRNLFYAKNLPLQPRLFEYYRVSLESARGLVPRRVH